MELVYLQHHLNDLTACLDDIPVGARFADPEISAMLSASIAAGLVACSTIMGQSIQRRYCDDVWTVSYSKGSTRS